MAKSGKKYIDLPEEELYGIKPEDYGDEYSNHLLKQYELFVQLSDKLSHRRTLANTFFLSINAVLVTVLGLFIEPESTIDLLYMGWIFMVMVAGISICYVWRATLRTYRALNSAKFQVINSIELKLPVAGFLAEWLYFNNKKDIEKLKDLTDAENLVPIVFAILYFIIFLLALVLALLPFIPS